MTSDSDNAAASPKRRGRPPKHKLDTQGTRVSPPALSSGQTNKRRKTTPEPSTITPPVSPPEMKKNGFTMMMEKKKKDGTDGSPSKSGSTKFHISPRKTEAVSPSADHASEANAPSNDIWPAPEENLEKAREFLRACASPPHDRPIIIVPDKDADGLSSGSIIHRTLTALGVPSSRLKCHLLTKGSNVHDESERRLMSSQNPSFVIVLDQGSRPSPPLVDNKDARVLILDHHWAEDGQFPEGAEVVSAAKHKPVATTSLLTYEICLPLHDSLESQISYLACIGAHGDLGTDVAKYTPPFPDFSQTYKQHSKKAITDAVALLNAPRRTSAFNVIDAWNAILNSNCAKDIIDEKTNPALHRAREEMAIETERHAHNAPLFNADGSIALIKIRSSAQVHPVIATRWAGFLGAKSKKLKVVMCANYGYEEGKVNFSCRVAKMARKDDPPVDIIQILKDYAAKDDDSSEELPLVERLGHNFARGHKEASGGIVKTEEFEELVKRMGILEKGAKKAMDKETKKAVGSVGMQKNTLANYFAKPKA